MGGVAACSSCCHDVGKIPPTVQSVGEDAPAHPLPQGLDAAVAQEREATPPFAAAAPAPSAAAPPPPVSDEESVPGTEHSAASTDASTAPSATADPEDTEAPGSDGSCGAQNNNDSAEAPDMEAAHQVVKGFVRALVRGRTITMLSVSGNLTECFVSLDRQLSTLMLARSSKKDAKRRGIALEHISEICVGEEAAGGVELPLDEHSVAILLEDGSALGFHFPDFEDRDTFALCMSMFVDGRKGRLSRKSRESGQGSPSRKVKRV